MARHRLSLRVRLMALAVATIVPLLGFGLVLQYLQYRDATTRTGERTRVLARSVTFSIEQELQKYIAVLETLALSPTLQANDLVSFRKHLELVAIWQFPGANFLLLDPTGRQLVNTAVPQGEALPARQNLEATQRAIDAGGPAVSDLYQGRVLRRPVIAIDVPVRRADGAIGWVLSMNPPADAFGQAINRQGLPPGWVIAVFDRRGIVLAREPHPDEYFGKEAAPSLLPHLLGGQREGVVETTTLEGVPVLTAFARSDVFGWSVAIGVPRAELSGPATETALRTLALGAILLLVSLALALAVSRRISRPIAALRQVAEEGTAALAALPETTGLAEADVVVSALRTAEARRQRSEQSFRYLFDSSPLPMWVYEPVSLRFLAVNDAAVETYGYAREEFLAMTLVDINPPEDHARMRQVVSDPPERQHSADWRHRYKDGRLVDIETFAHAIIFDGRPARVVVVLDVTARKAAEAQLVQAQKMEAVGQLTGGLAHDFNNLLGIILGNAGLLQSDPEDPDLALYVDEIMTAAQRGAALTRSLLAFSRRQPLRSERVDPNVLVTEITTLLRRTLGEHIEVTLDLAPDVWPVVVDPSQLESSLANLATNARDAMPKGGRLAIVSANRRLDADYAAEHVEVSAGDYVMIQVSDSGTGMPPEILAKVFEPFFTTKARGQGTGLGLSMVFGFIKQSGGHINVYSEVGVGTTFRLYLPRAGVASDATDAAPVETLARGRGERVLVVEDNEGLRRLAVRQLEQLGYRVATAENAGAAMTLLGEHGGFDLVFSDVVMAGKMDGFDLARTVAARWPRIRILMTSGFPGTDVVGQVEPAPNVRLLSKPYRREDLAHALRETLDADMAATSPI